MFLNDVLFKKCYSSWKIVLHSKACMKFIGNLADTHTIWHVASLQIIIQIVSARDSAIVSSNSRV
jgi:hypothetical protein